MGAMSDGYALEPGELKAASATLSTLGGSLGQQSIALSVTPDAASSSQEVAQAFVRLTEELGALAQAVTGAADALEASLAAYRTTDTQVGANMGGLMRP